MHVDCGFTRHTAKTLRNLGASDLIEEVKKRNISTSVLYKLTKEDFILLGSSEKQAEYLTSSLISKAKNTASISEPKLRSFIEILKQGEEQLSLLHAFLAHCRVRLQKENINFIIDPNKHVRASNLLCDASEAICSQLQSIEQAIMELEAPIKTMKSSKDEYKSQYTSRRLYVVASGISLAICTILCIFKMKLNVQFIKY